MTYPARTPEVLLFLHPNAAASRDYAVARIDTATKSIDLVGWSGRLGPKPSPADISATEASAEFIAWQAEKAGPVYTVKQIRDCFVDNTHPTDPHLALKKVISSPNVEVQVAMNLLETRDTPVPANHPKFQAMIQLFIDEGLSTPALEAMKQR